MNLIPDAPAPCYAVPEIKSCTGCMFNLSGRLQQCTESNSPWRMRTDTSCVAHETIYIPATEAGIAAYQAAFDAHQLKLITARLTK